MSFAAPGMLFLLPLVALAGWLTARGRRLQRAAACRLQGVAPPASREGLRRGDWLALAALGCTILALARPQWNPQPSEIQRRGRDLILALDVSRSMLAADVFPSRLEAARIAIHEALPAWAGQRIALLTFAGSAAVRVPLTLDHAFVRYMLDRADPSDVDLGSTSLEAALEKAVGPVMTDAAGSPRDLVLLTDGEDHLSNLQRARALLGQCRGRVLIVGLGDPLHGARVPAAGSSGWMQYHGTDVISRLDEGTLARLAGGSPRVTYYPARTRLPDLVPLYRKLIAGASDDVVTGALREVRYTEGYPILLALAAGLWLASMPRRLASAAPLVLWIAWLPGCNRPGEDPGAALYRTKFDQGSQMFAHAQEQAAADPAAGRALLLDAREAFLRAALVRPGDVAAARQITRVTRRLEEVDAGLEKQQAAEKKRREELSEIIRQLQQLAVRQARLARQSRQIVARHPPPPEEELNRQAPPAVTEQQAVQTGTSHFVEVIAAHRTTLRQLLTQAFGDSAKKLPTELDPAAELLDEARAAQHNAIDHLQPGAVRWPSANTALHVAAGRMQQAIEALRSLQPPADDSQANRTPPLGDNPYDADQESPEAGGKGKSSRPVAAGDFSTALGLQSLPIPNYTPAEILAEEAANQQKRVKQRAVRAAKVEKNW